MTSATPIALIKTLADPISPVSDGAAEATRRLDPECEPGPGATGFDEQTCWPC